MAHSLFPCFAEGRGSCVQLIVAMASGEGAGGRSLPTGQGILGRNRHRVRCLLHETLLGTSPKGCIQKEGEGCSSPCHHLCDPASTPGTNLPQTAMEVGQYGYCHGQAVDLGPIMLATQFRVTDEVGTYLCVVWALVFEGSILAYNPTRDEGEWVPMHGVTNDLSWVEEKSAMALANYVPRVSQEVAHIAGLRARRLVSWHDDSSSQEEDEQEAEEQGEAGPELLSSSTELEQGETEQEAEPRR